MNASLATEDGTNAALSGSISAAAPKVGEDASRATATALKNALAATPSEEMLGEAKTELAEEVATFLGEAAKSVIEEVAGAIGDVLDYIPGLAILSSAFKIVKSSVTLVMQAVRRLKLSRIVNTSISVIEREAMWSADWYVEREQEAEGLALGTAVLTGAAHAAGYAGAAAGPVAKAIGALAALTHKIVKLVADILRVRRFNRARAEGRRMDLQQLQDAPVLGLYLPHLPGCGGLHVLGVVPPGWNAADHTDEAELLRAKLQHPGNRDLLDSLSSAPPRMGGSAVAAARAVRQNPWSEELRR